MATLALARRSASRGTLKTQNVARRQVSRQAAAPRKQAAVSVAVPEVALPDLLSPSAGSTLSVALPHRYKTDLGVVNDPPSCDLRPKKTHIVCTLGPSSRTVEQISKLLMAGMSVARFNFSHGSHEYHKETLDNLREACAQTDKICAVLQDTKGPEIRTGMLKAGEPINLRRGTTITITSDYSTEGDDEMIAISYPHIARDVKPGNTILMADGAVMLEVLSCDEKAGTIDCRCMNDSKLGERKNCNLPGVVVDLPTLTEKDVHDLRDFGVENNVDFIAASFVRKGADIDRIREVLGEEGKGIRIIAKVENHEGLVNYNDIVDKSDGIMVARGDLGMEVPLSKMFWVQKMMIRKCNLVGKPVVTATQMLDSMIAAPRPTRAEATDVANAVLDGTDCVMLSGETAAGAYPIESVEIMAAICEEAENCVDNFEFSTQMVNATLGSSSSETMTTSEALASSAVLTAAKVDAALIVVLAANGSAARLISKYRPVQPIMVGVVPRERRVAIGFVERETSGQTIVRQCLLSRGLIPMEVTHKDDKMDAPSAAKECLLETVEEAKKRGLVEPGQKVVTMYNVEQQCAVVRVMVCP